MYRQNSCNCSTALIISVIVGIGVAVLFSLGFLTNVVVALWIVFGIGAASLIALSVLIPVSSVNVSCALKKCTQTYGRYLIAGAVGTIVSTLAALALPLSSESTALIIIFFLIGTFLSFLIISIIQFLLCIINFDFLNNNDSFR